MGTRYKQLQAEERMTLSSLHQQGWSLRAMGRLMGRSPSTLCRELRRNSSDGGYASSSAHHACLKRRIDARHNQDDRQYEGKEQAQGCLSQQAPPSGGRWLHD